MPPRHVAPLKRVSSRSLALLPRQLDGPAGLLPDQDQGRDGTEDGYYLGTAFYIGDGKWVTARHVVRDEEASGKPLFPVCNMAGLPIKVLDVGKGFVDYALISSPLSRRTGCSVVRWFPAGPSLLRDRLRRGQSVAGHGSPHRHRQQELLAGRW
jgi:hypothetical protein